LTLPPSAKDRTAARVRVRRNHNDQTRCRNSQSRCRSLYVHQPPLHVYYMSTDLPHQTPTACPLHVTQRPNPLLQTHCMSTACQTRLSAAHCMSTACHTPTKPVAANPDCMSTACRHRPHQTHCMATACRTLTTRPTACPLVLPPKASSQTPKRPKGISQTTSQSPLFGAKVGARFIVARCRGRG
jgi:hypothetical protein